MISQHCIASIAGTFLNEGRLEKNGQTDLRDSDEIIIGQASTTFKLLITPLVENSHPGALSAPLLVATSWPACVLPAHEYAA